MKRILFFILLFTSSSMAVASGWEISTVSDNGDVNTINTDKIKRIKTSFPSTSPVISGWVKTTFNNRDDNIVSKLDEYYIKCKEDEFIKNSSYLYRVDGTVAYSITNEVRNVDITKFQPVLPDTYGEIWFKDICNFSGIK
ncbi:hypothetical protein [Psychrobacter sp. BF1]|uniref:hypothetical protein n=1 Tax=Psychrobacter sp. BF1 TaxID=2821147 RepID=UPI001C4DE58B|nr:hypothetical protein [Psychrobacter sp. BF1]